MEKTYWVSVKHFLKFEGQKVKGHGHHRTKYEQKVSFVAIITLKCTRQELLYVENTSWDSVDHLKKIGPN